MTTSATLTDAIVGTALAPTRHRWTQTDVILYALGVGARRDVVSLRSGTATLAGC